MANKKDQEQSLEIQATAPEFYTNAVMIFVSAFEVELQNQLVDSQKNVKGAINIHMSPQTAWTLAKELNRQMDNYEKAYGPISLPADIKKRYD
ncbi:DUF3467 domain-containing protein [Leptospira sarikeiensis]|uniref:DUF3467 domain-containing protein n=1 Tax=Leptospira sarikeiensis TaxID=2484943 RepID=A0A4R9K2Y4_9LEPT|nr:DUF3467 domain-containing protein [Leptospira sarikeiensis]TGL58517.1 hypothetical protein EHQ64_18585 [Leptospira sarikeiensis]